MEHLEFPLQHYVDAEYKATNIKLSPHQFRMMLAEIIALVDWTDKSVTKDLVPKVNRDNLVDFATWLDELASREDKILKFTMTVVRTVNVANVPTDFDPYVSEWNAQEILDNHDDIEITVSDDGNTDFTDMTYDDFMETFKDL